MMLVIPANAIMHADSHDGSSSHRIWLVVRSHLHLSSGHIRIQQGYVLVINIARRRYLSGNMMIASLVVDQGKQPCKVGHVEVVQRFAESKTIPTIKSTSTPHKAGIRTRLDLRHSRPRLSILAP